MVLESRPGTGRVVSGLVIGLVLSFLMGHGFEAVAMDLTHTSHQVMVHEVDSSCLLLLKDPIGGDGSAVLVAEVASSQPEAPTGDQPRVEQAVPSLTRSIHELCVVRV